MPVKPKLKELKPRGGLAWWVPFALPFVLTFLVAIVILVCLFLERAAP